MWYNAVSERAEVHMKLQTSKPSSKAVIIILCVLLGAALAALGITLGVLLFGEDAPTVLHPDRAYEEKDPQIEPYPDQPGTLDPIAPEDGGMASFTCEAQLTVHLSAERVDLMFANPSRSQQNMVIEVCAGEQVIAQSGRIEPGYRVTSLPLLARERLTAGIYEASVRIYFYQPQTGVQMVDTSVPVMLTVKD
jgi:hypothetical protein